MAKNRLDIDEYCFYNIVYQSKDILIRTPKENPKYFEIMSNTLNQRFTCTYELLPELIRALKRLKEKRWSGEIE